MKFLANENIPFASIIFLRRNGIDIQSVKEINRGITDLQVMQISAEENRVILTFDKDYGEIIHRNKEKFTVGIVLFRFIPCNSDETGKMFLKIIQEPTIELEKKFTVIERDRLRQKNL
jgi:predicted nuclease of predicted toxin-antitoxin system